MSKFYYGGQAVIEGVLMRGQTKAVVAVRSPKGHILIHEEPLTPQVYKARWSRWPFFRGLVVLWDALVLGTKALIWSADAVLQEEAQVRGEASSGGFSGIMAGGTVLFSLAVGIGLFFLLPAFVIKLVNISSAWLSSTLEGGLRLTIFLLYLWIIGWSEEVRRVFAYHGAEHKTINAFEAGAVLTPEEVNRYSRFHVRCGTSFLLFVLLVSILIFAPFHFPNMLLRLLSRLVLIPVVAMVAYELIRVSAARPEHPLLRWLIVPGLLLQRLTTREPDLDMLEVAIAALVPVLVADGVMVNTASTSAVVTAPAQAGI